MHKRIVSLTLAMVMILALLAGCASTKKGSEGTTVPAEKVVLTVAGSWTDCKAIEVVAKEFTKKYPNCTVEYEYLQDYYASLQKRMSGEEAIDLFFTTNIQENSDMLPYALDLNSCKDFDTSNTFPGLISNFTFKGGNQLYAIPLGAEMRGLYINKTLLKSVGLEVPKDQASLLAACKVLKEKGYVPFGGNPGNFAQLLVYPWIANVVANADDYKTTYADVNARKAGISKIFVEPCRFLYTLVENNYYDYKTVQNERGLFKDAANEPMARDFLNIKVTGDTFTKVDDIGQVAFLASPMSLKGTIDKTKDDYHSAIDYVFIPAPVGKDGGYAYLSPAHGIAINKASANTQWAVEFLNFLYQPEVNKTFAENFNIIPNTKEAYSYLKALYNLPEDSISELGQVTFDYDFYNTIQETLTNISKANNPKYMKDEKTLYPFSYYMDQLEDSITKQ